MKVFVSWSGERSKAVATALRSWIKDVLQATDPWMSAVDIAAGSDWQKEIVTNIDPLCQGSCRTFRETRRVERTNLWGEKSSTA